MKKFLALLLTAMMVLSLAACGQKDPGTDAPAQNGDSEQTEPADTSAQPEEPQQGHR